MFIVITGAVMFAATVALLVLRLVRPQFRFSWLIAVGSTFLAWITVLLWRAELPLSISFGQWAPIDLLPTGPALVADQFSWIYALSLATFALAALLTATVRDDFPDAGLLAVTIGVCGLGLFAVTAGNPLTLALAWAALDLTELVATLMSAAGRAASRRVVTAFAVHAAAIVLLMLAQVTSGSRGKPVDFTTMSPAAGLLLLAAAGLRLGVLPLHLPYMPGSARRRGLGTSIRLVSAAASLVLLSHVQASSFSSLFAVLILIISAVATIYASWMWLRAPDELAGRPFWIIGLAGLALYCGLRGNPAGAAGWGVALILAGAALFLSSAQQVWLNRLLYVAVWSLSALPFSLTAAGWEGGPGILGLALPAFILAQAFLMAGFIRHVLRPASRTSLQSQPAWARSVYPAGIGLLLIVPFILGLWGWDGALHFGALPAAVIAALLTLALVWAVPRLRLLNPIPAHWLRPLSGSRFDAALQALTGLYRSLGGVSQTLTDVLEGEAGLMWTLLFLILFIVMIVQRTP